MRQKIDLQRSIFEADIDHSISRELRSISERLDQHPEFLDLISKDLIRTEVKDTGNKGMTVDNVLRAAIIKHYTGYTYRELEFHLIDSQTFQTFTRIFDICPSYTTLQTNIRAITSETWVEINRVLLHDAITEKIEKGRKIRVDSTVVETNIHKPTDSSLLWDGVRVMTRLLQQAENLWDKPLAPYHNHTRVCKKVARKIAFSCRNKSRLPFYIKLLDYTLKVAGYLGETLSKAHESSDFNPVRLAWISESRHILELVEKVVDQTTRRVIKGEKVPASEKIVSLFEDHTDIIKKGRRDTQYGHKINITAGESALVMDCVVELGNPPDSKQAVEMVKRQSDIYGRPPRQASFDGGYASKQNIEDIKGLGVKDVAFHKKRGIKVLDMVKSSWVFKRLKSFRAGVEAIIGTLKNRYDMKRLKTKGMKNFESAVQCSVVVYNLVTLTRLITS